MNWRFGRYTIHFDSDQKIHDSLSTLMIRPTSKQVVVDSSIQPTYGTTSRLKQSTGSIRMRWKAKWCNITIIKKLENTEFTSGLRLDFVRKLLEATAKHFFTKKYVYLIVWIYNGFMLWKGQGSVFKELLLNTWHWLKSLFKLFISKVIKFIWSIG